jgi:Tol biopolymer transport system component
MGEVYRARDTKLGRDVALKILPDAFATDPERLARFEREAKTLAALNHPNIGAIFGFEESDDIKALVLELVAGPTLADRITQGPIPLDEALPLAKQIAEALEAAHEKGVIHRDLKPGNIKITPAGVVKVLDFGLARAVPGSGELAAKPSLSSVLSDTRAGVIVGTAAYMSPEQAQAKPVDRRSDIWAFGCVLYEMLTGKRAFDGESVPDILSRVLQREPDWTFLPTGLPTRIRELLELCLEKNIKKRRQSAGDVRIDIEQALKGSREDARVRPTQSARSQRLAWIVAALFAVFGVLAIVWSLRRATERPEMRVQIVTPTPAGAYALSPDGRHIAFVASGSLWLRAVDTTDAQPIAGTDGADGPFWSPDSRSIAFFVSGKLFRVEIAGGPPRLLTNAPSPRGGTWNADGTILFGTASSPLMRVAASGGDPTAVTRIDPPQTIHGVPYFLPDGRHFVFYANAPQSMAGTYLGSLDGQESKRLTETGSRAEFLQPDLLVYLWEGALIGRRLDIRRAELIGDPVTIADPEPNNVIANFSVSASGHVAYRMSAGTRLTWFDRSGSPLGVVGEPRMGAGYPELAPNEQRVAIVRGLNADIWLIDLVRGGLTRLTTDAKDDLPSVWSPDGTRLAFASDRTGVYNLYVKQSNGLGQDKRLRESSNFNVPQDWSRDEKFLLYYEITRTTARDLWALDMTGIDRKPLIVANTVSDERTGQFSPDSHWVVYETNATGRNEIVVQSFPEPVDKLQVSSGGGIQPRWSADGKELYYIGSDRKLMAVSVTSRGNTLAITKPVVLFQTRILAGEAPFKQQYAVSRDGRFLINHVEQSTPSPITVILNWKPGP